MMGRSSSSLPVAVLGLWCLRWLVLVSIISSGGGGSKSSISGSSLLLLVQGQEEGGGNGGESRTLRALLVDEENLSLFRTAASNLGLLDTELDDPDEKFTIFAPTDSAMKANNYMDLYLQGVDNPAQPKWHYHLLRAIRNHMLAYSALTHEEIFDGTKADLFSMEDPLRVDNSLKTVQGGRFVTKDIMATNGVLHIIDKVLVPNFFTQSLENLEAQPEFGPDHLDRISLVDIVDFTNSRSEFRHLIPSGQTQVGCRIRALNRIGLFYLPKTINRSPEIKFGEFMNASFKKETVHNLIQYSMIHKSYYLEDIPTPHDEWIMSSNGCSHMLISKSLAGDLCFNDGCVVESPMPLSFIRSNGIGYVVDKCIVCSGVAMLLEYAAVFTQRWNLKDASQFWETSEWNLRNLSMSAGNGGPLTVLAAQDNAFNIFNAEDATRISTDKWKIHQWNFLHHNMFQGNFTKVDFIEMWKKNLGKPWNITALSGENVTFDYDEENKDILIQGGGSEMGRRVGPWGKILLPDIKGVDGYLHIIETLPVPKSVTHSVYDLANEWVNYSTHIKLIDTLFLKQDLKRLEPITALFAPDSDWDNKVIEVEEISKSVLENMVFKGSSEYPLYWCAVLRKLKDERLESHNGQTWKISVNETTNMPCFDTEQVFGGPVRRSCITKCDILVRNGIIHQVDKVLFFEVPETSGPQPPAIPTYRAPNAPNFYTPPSPPSPGWHLDRPTFYGPINPAYVAKGDLVNTTSGAAAMTMPMTTTMLFWSTSLWFGFVGWWFMA